MKSKITTFVKTISLVVITIALLLLGLYLVLVIAAAVNVNIREHKLRSLYLSYSDNVSSVSFSEISDSALIMSVFDWEIYEAFVEMKDGGKIIIFNPSTELPLISGFGKFSFRTICMKDEDKIDTYRMDIDFNDEDIKRRLGLGIELNTTQDILENYYEIQSKLESWTKEAATKKPASDLDSANCYFVVPINIK